jgi:transposase-like protein
VGNELKTLQDAITYFSNPVNCREYVVARRWPNGVTCPTCGSEKVKFSEKHNRWQCASHHARRQFTVKTGTIFKDSPLGLDKWLCAMWQVVNCKNGVSSYEVHRAIGVTQKTAWFIDHRIRLALRMGSFEKLTGEVKVDETFIGGLARNMHREKREARITGTGGKDKTAVMGFLARGGEVRTEIIPNRKRMTLHGMVKGQVATGSALYTDSLASYEGLDGEFFHQDVDQAVEYVNGDVHTNGLESFWSPLKRGLKRTYISVEPFHIFRYLDEQVFRYNGRHLTDAERFDIAIRGIIGKRLTFSELTGKSRSTENLLC